jgi:C1A family cysteine protease
MPRTCFAVLVMSVILLAAAPLLADPSAPGGSFDRMEAQGTGWLAGHTSLSDLTLEQKKARLGFIPTSEPIFAPPFVPTMDPAELPTHLDWRDKDGGRVTPVRDQSDCGSCYIFSGIGAMEANWAIRLQINNPHLNLSEQYSLSCEFDHGCDGGLVRDVLSAAREVGVPDEECFPYDAWETPCGQKCDDWTSRTLGLEEYQVVLDDFADTQEEYTLIMQALQHGPVTVSFEVCENFFDYEYGVYYCSDLSVGWHAVVIVGYDSDDEYWICKNSWGSGWGDSGYFRIRWGESNMGYETLLPVPPPCTGDQLVVRGANLGEGFLRYERTALPVTIRLTNDCGRGETGATLTATYNGSTFALYDDGMHDDGGIGDGVYHGVIPADRIQWGPAEILVTAEKAGLTAGELALHGAIKYPADILLIADDGDYEGDAFFREALDALGVDYDLLSVSEQHRRFPEELLPFAPAVLWFTGPKLVRLTDSQETAVREYLDNGGRLLLSGQDFLQGTFDYRAQFVREYLKVKRYWNDTQPNVAKGIANEPLTKGIHSDLTYPFVNYGDVIDLMEGAAPIWRSQADRPIGLRYPADGAEGPYQLAFCSYPLEAMPVADATKFIGRVVDWFFADECLDTDGDGYGTGGACDGELDCENDEPTVYPGAPEICDDGLDNDCNGLTDGDDPACEGVDDDDNDDTVPPDDDDNDDAADDDDDDSSEGCGC